MPLLKNLRLEATEKLKMSTCRVLKNLSERITIMELDNWDKS